MASEPYFVSPGDRLTAGWMNAVVGSIKRRNNSTGRKLQFAGGTSEECPFGEIFFDDKSNPPQQKVRGGIVYCGDKNLTVPGHPVNVDSAREVRLFLKIPFTVNIDDDKQFLLPGVDTTDWTPAFVEQAGDSDFPSNTNPEVPAATAEIIIPIGFLTVKDKIANFSSTGPCGNKRVNHCGGNISFQTELPIEQIIVGPSPQ